MKKNIIIAAIAAASALLLCASCQKQELIEQNNGINASGKTFTATIEQGLTKTTITSEYKVNWVEGDQIDINGSIFSATPDASDATKATFTKVSGSDPTPDYTAVYPASIMVETQATLPATQTYAAGKFNAPMCAMSSTKSLEFKNFCGVLCFALKGTDNVKSIAVTANEQLCGPFEFADATSFSFTEENKGYTVTLDCGEGVQLSSTDSTNFYVYLPPKDSYTAGMKIVVTSTEGKTFEKTTTTAVKIERNNLYTFDWTATFTDSSPVAVTNVSLDKTELPLTVGAEETLTATVLPENATNKAVTWSSSATTVATVDDSGKVTAVAPGEATITVTTTDGGNTATCAVTVIPAGALAGEFSVSATKKVHFSKGNLWYGPVTEGAPATFNFEANQYDTTPASGIFEIWSSDHISHFYWSKSVDEAVKEEYNWDQDVADTDVFFTNKEGFKVNVGGTEQTGWRTLSTAEWQYLFNTRTDAASKMGFATVGGVNGIIILPDNFTDPMKNNGNGAFVPKSSTGWDKNVYTSGDNWNAMESAGAVFLPAAGQRCESHVEDYSGKGIYWSSTARNSSYAYYRNFDISYVSDSPDNYAWRYLGFSVRLITEPGAPAPQVISVESVSLNKSTLELAVGSDETLTATVTPDNATNKNVSWSSSDESVATVDASGKVTAVAAGTATITVTTTDGGKTTTCAVTVIPAGALAGEFSVSATKKVHFSKGNLYAKRSSSTSNDWSWGFYDKQYKFHSSSMPQISTSGSGGSRKAAAEDTEIDLFTWGYDDTYSINPKSNNTVTSFTDWGSISGLPPTLGGDWRTLTKAEWEWLLGPSSNPNPGTNCRTSSEVKGTANARYLKCKVNDGTRDVYGLMIFPDTFNWPTGTGAPSLSSLTADYINKKDLSWTATDFPGYTSSEFEALEKAGVVFLPAAGYRNGTIVYSVGSCGYYWSSMASSSTEAYFLYFLSSHVFPTYGRCNYGRSVRLVSVVQ